MSSHNFENLEIWKRSCRLAVDVCADFMEARPYVLRAQIQKSAISIPSNISEGADKPSTPDLLRFLGYSSGSCAELRTQLLVYLGICKKLNTAPVTDVSPMVEETRELSKMIQGFSNHLKQS